MTTTDPIDPRDRRLWERLAGPAAVGAPCPTAGPLAAFLDGRDEPEAREAMEAHLADCADCRAAVRELRPLLAAPPGAAPRSMVRAAQRAVGAGTDDGARWRIEVIGQPGRSGWRAFGRWTAAAAAMIAVCLVGYQAGASSFGADRTLDDEVVAEMSFGLLETPDADDAEMAVLTTMIEGASR